MAAQDVITESQGQTIALDLSTAIKALKTLVNSNAADLSALTTTEKGTIVGAMNDLQAQVTAAAASGGAVINDAATNTSSVWSSSKTDTEITSAVDARTNAVWGGAGNISALLAEVGTTDADLLDSIANRLRFDAAQTLSAAEQLQALNNLGVIRSIYDFSAQIATALT